jgi:hypothetical protein
MQTGTGRRFIFVHDAGDEKGEGKETDRQEGFEHGLVRFEFRSAEGSENAISEPDDENAGGGKNGNRMSIMKLLHGPPP